MGAGASAGIAAAVTAAKEDELAEMMKKLPESEREKISKALSGDGAAKDAGVDKKLEDALTALFQTYDIDKSGFVTLDEFLAIDKVFSQECGAEFDEAETRKSFTESDKNKDEKVSLKEYIDSFKKIATDVGLADSGLLAMVEQTNSMLTAAKAKGEPKVSLEDVLTAMFHIYDLDKSGFVTLDECMKMDKVFCEQCGATYDEADTKKYFSDSDENKDNKVSLKEFIASFAKTAKDAGLDEEAQFAMVKLTNDMLLESKAKEAAKE